MTDAERALWRYLRLRQLAGHHFPRQVRIGTHIADFACLKAMLIIEVDGGQRAEARVYDTSRDDFMRSQGYRILRFWNDEDLGNSEDVWETIVAELNNKQQRGITPSRPSPARGKWFPS